MSNVVSLTDKKEGIKKGREGKFVHAQASYAVLENCLNYLKMNDLEELKDVKKEIVAAMKKLREISINGK